MFVLKVCNAVNQNQLFARLKPKATCPGFEIDKLRAVGIIFEGLFKFWNALLVLSDG